MKYSTERKMNPNYEVQEADALYIHVTDDITFQITVNPDSKEMKIHKSNFGIGRGSILIEPCVSNVIVIK